MRAKYRYSFVHAIATSLAPSGQFGDRFKKAPRPGASGPGLERSIKLLIDLIPLFLKNIG